MDSFKRSIGVFAFTCFCIACANDVAKPDYSAFLLQRDPIFSGTIDGISFEWHQWWGYDFYESRWQTGICCGGNDSTRILDFKLYSMDGKQLARIYTPLYDLRSLGGPGDPFAIGKKKLGPISEGYHLVITKDGATFEATELGKGNVEILKIEEFKTSPSFKPSLRVWMRIEGDLSPCNCKTAKDKLDEVFLIANFIDYSS